MLVTGAGVLFQYFHAHHKKIVDEIIGKEIYRNSTITPEP